jgi:small-conductance mechanosensitive channel
MSALSGRGIRWGRLVRVSWLALLCVWGLRAGFAAGPLAEAQTEAARRSVVGEWDVSIGEERIVLRLTDEGVCRLDGARGTYTIQGNTLTLRMAGAETAYQVKLEGNRLTLSGGDLTQELIFSRRPQMYDHASWVIHFSPRSAARKLVSLLIIVLVLAAAQSLIWLLKSLARTMVTSDWGPLRWLYPSYKKRALTIHSLLLNLAKYVVYFVALGAILSELGINYTIYLASLSVVGLAVGFGSQGLVQDMVTGFFILFESQCDVGDMVEISGQVGIVEELGLRMTKLRNYLGQTVTIPNRNIAVVGNYTRGAQHAHVDVATTPETADRAAHLLRQIGEEIARQFSGVVVDRPKVEKAVSLKTDEHFARLALAFWPQQQWIVEQQIVPRVQEIFQREGLEIPNNRVTAFYHVRERRPVPTFARPRPDTADG